MGLVWLGWVLGSFFCFEWVFLKGFHGVFVVFLNKFFHDFKGVFGLFAMFCFFWCFSSLF